MRTPEQLELDIADAKAAAVELYPRMVADLFKMMPSAVESFLHAAIGISGETGELVEAVLNDDLPNVTEEFGDLLFYFTALLNLRNKNLLTLVPLFPPTDPEGDASGQHLLIASAAILDQIKKAWVYGKALDLDAIDAMLPAWYGAFLQCLTGCELDLYDVIRANTDKLSKRYPTGRYTDQHARERLDKVSDCVDHNDYGTGGMTCLSCATVAVPEEGRHYD